MAHTNQLRETLEKNHEILHVLPVEVLIEEQRQRKLRTAKGLAGYVSPAKDTFTAIKLCRELGITGRVAATTAANGRTYLIVKGHPGLRSVLTGTRYLQSNIKVVRLAIGRLGVSTAIAGGAMLTVVLYAGIDLLEYILDDHATLSMLSGTLATDLMKVGISSIVGLIMGLGVGVISTYAALPYVVAIVIGTGTNILLDYIDKTYGLTDKVVAALDKYAQEIAEKKENLEESLGIKYHEIEREVIWRMYKFDIDNPYSY